MQAIITVSQPCKEDWASMPAHKNGHFCAACAHTVIDFTDWELNDIAAYLKANATQRPCGRFQNNQLAKPFDLITLAPDIIHWNGNRWHKMAALIIICFGLAVTSCSHPEKPEAKAIRPFPVITGTSKIAGDSCTIITETAQVGIPVATVGTVEPYDGGHTMGVPALEIVVMERPESKDTVTVNDRFIGPPEDLDPTDEISTDSLR